MVAKGFIQISGHYHAASKRSVVGLLTPDRVRVATAEEETVLWHSLHSDNPTVRDAIERLVIATKLAHGEEIADERRSLNSLVQYVKEQAVLDKVQNRILDEWESQANDQKAASKNGLVIFAMVCIAIGTVVAMALGG